MSPAIFRFEDACCGIEREPIAKWRQCSVCLRMNFVHHDVDVEVRSVIVRDNHILMVLVTEFTKSVQSTDCPLLSASASLPAASRVRNGIPGHRIADSFPLLPASRRQQYRNPADCWKEVRPLSERLCLSPDPAQWSCIAQDGENYFGLYAFVSTLLRSFFLDMERDDVLHLFAYCGECDVQLMPQDHCHCRTSSIAQDNVFADHRGDSGLEIASVCILDRMRIPNAARRMYSLSVSAALFACTTECCLFLIRDTNVDS